MRCPSKAKNEPERLRAIAEYGLDPAKAPDLDPIVDVAARMFDCPAAAVNIIGDDHVFLASSYGIDDYDRSRDVSFCAHAITQDEVMVVEDALLDPRFHDNPIVTSGFIRFYAGVPLRSAAGHAIGALCVIDTKPHARFSEQDRIRLQELAKLALDRLELRRLRIAGAPQALRFEASAATSPNAIICFDSHAKVTAWNDAATTMFGRAADDMMGRPLDLIVAEKDRTVVHKAIERVLSGGTPKTEGTELIGVRATGDTFPLELHWSCWHEGEDTHFGAIVRDISDKKEDHAALHRLANYDVLTGLPNRNMLRQKTSEAIAAGSALALIVVDLDGFTDINNTLGHAAGDSLLRLIAGRLGQVAHTADCVFRIGGDEFAVLAVDERDPRRLCGIADQINVAIAVPTEIDGHEVRIASSCGIALAPDHGRTFEEVMSSAELALFQTRSASRGGVCLFTPAFRADAVARRMYGAELHRALERGEFALFYQPQVLLDDGALIGAEALIRWKHPSRGLLSPAAFLPALENGVLAEPTGRWVLEAACAQAAAWRELHPDFHISVNLFGAQFRSGHLPRLVNHTLGLNGLPPEALELEITENIILDQQVSARVQLEDLRRLGVRLSFDDFGTGYASLNFLRDYPVTQIKIDKSFTQVLQTSPKDRAIVMSMIDLAKRLGLKVVAEGIEMEEDCRFLRSLGCDKGQGYLFGKPVPSALFAEKFLTSGLARRAG